MQNEDNEFFILVLGVLAAIIMVVSWWYTSGGTASQVTLAAESAQTTDADHNSEDDDHAASDTDRADSETDDAGDANEDATFEQQPDADDDEAGDEGAGDTASDGADGDVRPASLLDAMLANSDLSVITNLLREEGLDDVLAATDGDAYTVFAPSDDAISAAAGSDTTVAVLEGDRAGVLTYHVVPGSYSVSELAELARGSRTSAQLVTLQGEPISVTVEGESVVLNGTTVLTAETPTAGTGVVHTLDNMLVPPVAALNTLVAAEPILFATGSADIEAGSFATLDRFIEVLSNNDVSVSIEGHTDSSGDAILNQNLSQSRARSVLNYLVANGIDESRLSATGFGSSKPVADNDSEEGRALNRRIEFTLN